MSELDLLVDHRDRHGADQKLDGPGVDVEEEDVGVEGAGRRARSEEVDVSELGRGGWEEDVQGEEGVQKEG